MSESTPRVDMLGKLVSTGDVLITQRGELLVALDAEPSIWTRGRAIAVEPLRGKKEKTYRPASMLVRIDVTYWPAAMSQRQITELWETLTVTAREAKRLELRERRRVYSSM
jgi:hypothetical protein